MDLPRINKGTVVFPAGLLLCSPSVFATVGAHKDTRIFVRSTVLWSADHTLQARILYFKRKPQPGYYGGPESRVEIRTARRRLVTATDYFSESGNSGETITKAAWTADSRFFVYSMENSGGHHPWRQPISFYCLQRHKFYSLDQVLVCIGNGGGPITDTFRLRKSCTLITRGRYYDKGSPGIQIHNVADSSGEKTLIINLQRIERSLSPAVEDRVYFHPDPVVDK